MTRRGALAALILLACPVPMQAVESSPKDFLEALYAAYNGTSDRSRGVPLGTEATVRRYFEPQLAALIIKDFNSARKSGEVPTLDGDPFIDGQEWEVEQLAITVREQGAGKASGTVTFKNFGAPTAVNLDLVRAKDGWRIAEIKWADRRTLRGLYTRR